MRRGRPRKARRRSPDGDQRVGGLRSSVGGQRSARARDQATRKRSGQVASSERTQPSRANAVAITVGAEEEPTARRGGFGRRRPARDSRPSDGTVTRRALPRASARDARPPRSCALEGFEETAAGAVIGATQLRTALGTSATAKSDGPGKPTSAPRTDDEGSGTAAASAPGRPSDVARRRAHPNIRAGDRARPRVALRRGLAPARHPRGSRAR